MPSNFFDDLPDAVAFTRIRVAVRFPPMATLEFYIIFYFGSPLVWKEPSAMASYHLTSKKAPPKRDAM